MNRLGRLCAALLVGAQLLAGLLLAGLLLPTPAAAADPAGQLPLSVHLTGLSPIAPQPHDIISLAATVTNTSHSTVRDLQAEVAIGGVIGNRSQLDNLAADPAGYVGPPVPSSNTAVQPTQLAPGAHLALTVTVPADSLQLLQAGVYPFGVDIFGDGGAVVGRLRTFLPWAPPNSIPEPARVAWLWPLVDRPHRGASTVFNDDALASELAPHGRLDVLLHTAADAAHPSAGRPVSVTWAVDPLLLSDASLMSRGYEVRKGGRTVSESGAAAAAWLSAARAALSSADVLTLPYADVDANALIRNGQAALVQDAEVSGTQVAERVLGRPLPTGRYWPPGGFLAPDAVSTLFAANTTQLVLSSDALPASPNLTFTPSARTTVPVVGGTVDVAVTDSSIDSAVDAGTHGDSRLAEQRFLAETLLFTEELPSQQRDLVIAPSRRWDPSATYAAALLRDTGNVPWIAPVTLSDVFAGPPSDAPREPLRYPPGARAAELPAAYLSAVGRTAAQVRTLEDVLANPQTPLARELYLSTFRTASAAWRTDRRAGEALLDQVTRAAATTRADVSIVSSGLVTLTSRSGAVPITIANRLPQTVRITLHLDAGPHARITGPQPVYVLPANQLHQVQVHLQAQTDGVFLMRTQLYTPTSPPQPYSAAHDLYVRSTAYGTLAVGISGGALAALLLASGVQVFRRVRRTGSRPREHAPT